MGQSARSHHRLPHPPPLPADTDEAGEGQPLRRTSQSQLQLAISIRAHDPSSRMRSARRSGDRAAPLRPVPSAYAVGRRHCPEKRKRSNEVSSLATGLAMAERTCRRVGALRRQLVGQSSGIAPGMGRHLLPWAILPRGARPVSGPAQEQPLGQTAVQRRSDSGQARERQPW